jgi:hypothetical protein
MSTFSENEVVICQYYLPTGGKDSQRQVAEAAMAGIYVEDQLIPTYTPGGTEVNQRARSVNVARKILTTVLQASLSDLQVLDEIYSEMRKRECGVALTKLQGLTTTSVTLPSMTSAQVTDALTANPIRWMSYEDPAEPLNHELPGYSGPDLGIFGITALRDLLTGGVEHRFRAGILQAECHFEKREFELAITHYDNLIYGLSGLPDLRRKFVAIRCGFAHLCNADDEYRKSHKENDRLEVARDEYEAARKVLQDAAVSPDNPRYGEIVGYVEMQLAKMDNHQNFLGLRNSFVPVQTAEFLYGMAKERLVGLKEAAEKLEHYLDEAGQKEDILAELQWEKFEAERNDGDYTDPTGEKKKGKAAENVEKAEGQLAVLDRKKEQLEEKRLFSTNTAKRFSSILAGAASALAESASASSTGHVSTTSFTGPVSTTVDFLAKDEELADQIELIDLERDVASHELNIANIELQISQRRKEFVTDRLEVTGGRLLNADLYRALANTYKDVVDARTCDVTRWLYLYERAVAFKSVQPRLSIVDLNYWDEQTKWFNVSKLDQALNAIEAAAIPPTREATPEISMSLKEKYPLEFADFQQKGKMHFVISQYDVDKWWPGYYQCRIQDVILELQGLVPPIGWTGDLTHWGTFMVRDWDLKASYLVPTDAELRVGIEQAREGMVQGVQVGGIILYCLKESTTDLHEGMNMENGIWEESHNLEPVQLYGPTGMYSIELRGLDPTRITDIFLKLKMTSPEQDQDLKEHIEELIKAYERDKSGHKPLDKTTVFSMKNGVDKFREAFDKLPGEASLELTAEDFPQGITNLRLKALVVQALDKDGQGVANVALHVFTSWNGAPAPWAPPQWVIY